MNLISSASARRLLGAVPLSLAVVLGCATVQVVEEKEETSAPVVPPDPCAQLVSREACCEAGCYWLEPTESTRAFCFSPDRECNDFGCAEGEVCYSHDRVLTDAECTRNYGLIVGRPFGVCIDACPDELQPGYEICEEQ